MRRVRSGRGHVLKGAVLSACFATACAGVLALGVGLLAVGERAPVAGGVGVAQSPIDRGRNAVAAPAIDVPRLQLPAVPTVRPVADAIEGGAAVAIGIIVLAYVGPATRRPVSLRSRWSYRLASRGPPVRVVARP